MIKHCYRERPILPQIKYSNLSGGLLCPVYLSKQEEQCGQHKLAWGAEHCSPPLRAKASASWFSHPPQMWLQDVQMLCAASMGAVGDPRPTIISCWLFGKKGPFLVTVCSVLDHRSRVHGVQSSFGLIKLSFNFLRKDTHYLFFWRKPTSKFILGVAFFK